MYIIFFDLEREIRGRQINEETEQRTVFWPNQQIFPIPFFHVTFTLKDRKKILTFSSSIATTRMTLLLANETEGAFCQVILRRLFGVFLFCLFGKRQKHGEANLPCFLLLQFKCAILGQSSHLATNSKHERKTKRIIVQGH